MLQLAARISTDFSAI